MALLSGTPGETSPDPQPPSCPTTGGEDASADRLNPLLPPDSRKIESNSSKIASSEELPHTDMKLGHDVCMVDKKFVEGGDSRQGELVEVDVGSHFETQQLFASKELLIQWVRAVSRGLGFVVTIRASDKIVGRLSPRVFLGCDRGGIHRDKQSKVNVKKRTRKRSSKRCGCRHGEDITSLLRKHGHLYTCRGLPCHGQARVVVRLLGWMKYDIS